MKLSMKLPLCRILLFALFAVPLAAEEPKKPKEVEGEKPYAELIDKLSYCMLAPGPLALTITDEKSLKKAISDLDEVSAEFAILSKELQKLDVPDKGAKDKASDKMSSEEDEWHDKNEESFSRHIEKMPKPFLKEWEKAIRRYVKASYEYQRCFLNISRPSIH